VSAQVINKRRLEKPEARKASREQALREVRAPLRRLFRRAPTGHFHVGGVLVQMDRHASGASGQAPHTATHSVTTAS